MNPSVASDACLFPIKRTHMEFKKWLRKDVMLFKTKVRAVDIDSIYNVKFQKHHMLTLIAPIPTAADDKFCDIFSNFRKKYGMIFHENRLPSDDSHEIACLICYFWKSSKIWNCRLLQIIGAFHMLMESVYKYFTISDSSRIFLCVIWKQSYIDTLLVL